MLTDAAQSLSYVLSIISFFGLTFLFGDALFLRFDKKTFLKGTGFFLLGIASVFNLLSHGFSQETIWMFAAAFVILFFAFLMDEHSRLKILFPLPIVLFIFLKGHILLLVIAILITITIFQLVYSTRHNDLIPLGIAFVLISVAEYFLYLENIESLRA